MSLYDIRGVIHCHSTESGGSGSVADIAKAANEVGLDFVVINDANTQKARAEEKYHGSTLVIVGAEIAPEGGNRYLVIGDEPIQGVEKLKDKDPQAVIDEIARQGALGFISDPDSQGSKRFGRAAKPWTAWDAQNYTGLALWNLTTDWFSQVERDTSTVQDHKEFESALAGARTETIKRWDQLLQKRKVVGIGEVEAYDLKLDFAGESVQVFPYETALKTITNHLLLTKPLDKNPGKAKKQILEALKAGRLYVSFDWWDDPTDFVFEIDNGKKTALMGEEIAMGEKTELVVTVPEEALINVFHNGESIHEEENDEVLIEISQPGVYRVEAMRDNLTWVLSNPIWVKK